MKTVTAINFPNVREEAKRLNSLGALLISFDNDAKPTERQTPIKGRVVGFAIDGEERDCILVLGPYGASGRFAVRCLVASHITRIEVLGGKAGIFLGFG